jgi:hypothetical protein
MKKAWFKSWKKTFEREEKNSKTCVKEGKGSTTPINNYYKRRKIKEVYANSTFRHFKFTTSSNAFQPHL